mmetsp:Transcript_112074/g.194607  ORF Transcript_112074/g.194607 Transcript_112074/m.194607 type:complete len:360 (-) Transcript_112074:502-1581(-)
MTAETSSPQKRLKIGDLSLSLAHPKLLKSFNTWLVGGNYSSPRKFGDFTAMGEKNRPVCLDQELLEEEQRKDEKLRERIAEKQEKLKAERNKPKHMYLDKKAGLVTNYESTSTRSRATGTHAEDSSQRSDRRCKSGSKRQPISTSGSPVQAMEQMRQTRLQQMQQQQERRETLKLELLAQSATSSYQTLFPPLFAPFDKTPPVVQTWVEMKDLPGTAARSPRKPESPKRVPVGETNSLSILKHGHGRRRAGNNAFMPTGSTSTAYRCYTNYQMAVELVHNDDRRKQSDAGPVGIVYPADHASNRAMSASTKNPPSLNLDQALGLAIESTPASASSSRGGLRRGRPVPVGGSSSQTIAAA